MQGCKLCQTLQRKNGFVAAVCFFYSIHFPLWVFASYFHDDDDDDDDVVVSADAV